MKANGTILDYEFLSMLIHELRDPLAPVMMSLKVLDEYHERETPPKFIKQHKEIIQRQVTSIVNSLSDVSDIIATEKGFLKIEIGKVEICSLVEKIIKEIKPIADSRKVFISTTFPNKGVWVKGEKKKLEQAFLRIFTTALRMTESGDTLSVTSNPSSSQVVVSAFASKPCTPHSGTELNLKSMGIGFLLAQQIIALHGGMVERTMENIEQGVEFSVVLPLFETSRERCFAEEPTKPVQIRKRKSQKIMVVDDYPDTVESLSTVLKFMGHQVEKCHSGIRAVEEAKITKPDIIMLDIGMPGLNGYEVAQELKRDLPSTRLLAVTGYGEETDKRKIKKAGFYRHLIKPVEFDLLEEALCEVACVNE